MGIKAALVNSDVISPQKILELALMWDLCQLLLEVFVCFLILTFTQVIAKYFQLKLMDYLQI